MTPGIAFILEQLGQALQNAEARIRHLEEALKDALEQVPARTVDPSE